MKHEKLINSFIFESLLGEAIRLSKNSIDDQVDSILLRFESDCIVDDFEEIGESKLYEAPGDKGNEKDEEGDEDTQAPKPELGTPSDVEKDADVEEKTGDKDDVKPDEESEPLQPKIDLHRFAGKVSRLASNYESLLDMSIAIVNRAKNYLEQNYSPAVAEEFAEIMERDFDIELEKDSTSEPVEKPFGVGAAASGLGG